PKLMVVSQDPHKGSFKENLGEEWADGMNNEGTPRTLFKWLDLDFEKAKRIIFWIQRMNCAFDKGYGLETAQRDCSSMFIPRALKSVEPELIITIGRAASEWFFSGKKLVELVGTQKEYVFESRKISFIAFPHSSSMNRAWIAINEPLLEKSKTLAREVIKRF
ncbi:MAG: uracil-DNA glycosylase family protein, partial [Candidatus Thorarchaeota archaeon]